jgi:hypothetical protein
MSLVRYIPKAGSELTPEEREAAKRRIEEAAKYPIKFTPDCPKLTIEQLMEFEPVGMTWEERERRMKELQKTEKEPRKKLELAKAV